ncbi:ABC transporter permease subunit, partial [Stomatohabitans albus]|uniref:ABC transporter permease subunit n=1 Tax=Stomatohabitans albus TaxID=3110766 RepID=UPI00300C1F01
DEQQVRDAMAGYLMVDGEIVEPWKSMDKQGPIHPRQPSLHVASETDKPDAKPNSPQPSPHQPVLVSSTQLPATDGAQAAAQVSGLRIYQPGAHRPVVALPGQVVVVLGSPTEGVDALVDTITGLNNHKGWHAHWNDVALEGHTLLERTRMGLAWIPDDRTEYGPAPNMTIAANTAMAVPGSPVWSPHGWIRQRQLRHLSQRVIHSAQALQGIRPTRFIRALSGGQTQAVMIGRALAVNPAVLLACNPAQGLDPGATTDLVATLRDQAANGCAVVVTTTDSLFAQQVGDRFWKADQGNLIPMQPLGAPTHQTHPPRAPIIPQPQRLTIPGPLIAVLIAVCAAAGVVSLWGANPLHVTQDLIQFAWFTSAGQGAMLAHLAPLLVIAAGVAVMFRADVIGIGAEGQLYAGALSAAIIGQYAGIPGWVGSVFALLGGALAGGIWAVPVAWLKARLQANEIVVSLIFNALGVLGCAWLVAGPFNGGQGALTTAPVVYATRLPTSILGLIGADVFIAILTLTITAIVLAYSRWGLGTRYLGQGIKRAQAMGINPPRRQAQVLVIGGALAGLAGALVVLGPAGGRFSMVFSPGYGFMAIMIALVGAYRGWGIAIAALAFTTVMAGAGAIQLSSGIPLAITGVIQGVLVLCVTMRIRLPARARCTHDKPNPEESR